MDRQSTMETPLPPLRLLIAGGGTGGHISPAIAVLEELRHRQLRVEPIWIGSARSFEEAAATEQDIPFYPIRVGKLRRYMSFATVADSMRIPVGIVQARRHLRQLRPHVIFSTGGYVSVPTVIAGRSMRTPILTHEQTATIGLATRINARFSDVVALSYSGTPHPRTRSGTRIVVTGNPVRSSVARGDISAARAYFGLACDRPLVYVTGGVQGAQAVNQAVAGALPQLLEQVQIVHQCGPDRINQDYSRLRQMKEQLPETLASHYHPVERVGPELKDLYTAASLVVGRAGAGTVAELAALGIPSILIPLPGADEQLRNAAILSDAGGSILLPQTELSQERLTQEIHRLIGDPDRLQSMGRQAASVAPENPAGALVDEILSLARRYT